MNRSGVVAMIGMIGFLIGAQTAQADIVRLKSKIAEINTTGNYFKAYRLDPSTKKIEEIKIDVDSSTIFKGVGALRDLKTGDEVAIQANFDNFTHEWLALEIIYVGPVVVVETK